MAMVSARIAAAAIMVAALLPPDHAAQAFGLSFGPFHLGLPLSGRHRHRHPRLARSEPSASEQSGPPTLLYPVLALPSLFDEIFVPNTSSSWAFGYDDIFDQAFGKYPRRPTADLCPRRDNTTELVARITRTTAPDAAQRPLLQKLATALGQANGYLIKSCPTVIPPEPIARLQRMEVQIDATIMALDIVRPRLQKFEQSLNDEQRARLDGSGAALDGIAPACRQRAGSPQESVARLTQAVQPTAAQRKELTKVEDALKRAANDLDADCPGAVARTALGRLEATEARLDATWRAILTIEVALADFQKSLSGEQNTRFNSLQIASVR
jgi:hypothetical protein